jgi:uncharacterized protein YcnI
MIRIRSLFVVLFFFALPALPAFAHQDGKMAESKEMAAPKKIAGAVQSFSGNILDIKPPTNAPAVWVTIPEGMKVDRSALKPGVEVTVEARWATVTYVAVKPPEIVTMKMKK